MANDKMPTKKPGLPPGLTAPPRPFGKTIEPFHNQVVFRRFAPDQLPSGLHVPETVGGSRIKCIVAAVGPGLILPSSGERMAATPLVPGDEIVVKATAQVTVVEQTGETLYMVSDGDIIGRIVDEKTKLEAV